MPMSKEKFLHELKELILHEDPFDGDEEKEKLLTLKLLDIVLFLTASIVKDDLKSEGEGLLPYFGRFYLKQLKGRRMKPPALGGRMIDVPPKTLIKFKPRSMLKELEKELNR